MKMIFIPMFAALAGCVTVPVAPAAPSESVRLAVSKTALELRGLVQALADPVAVPGFEAASAVLTEARLAVAQEAVGAGLAQQAELAALGVTLKICADGVERLEAERLSRGEFVVTCLGPLGWFEVRG
ncbi:hypothetical protein [Sandaracinobacteroides hominis]|uniref:hypothetical protein n=1 Tax=Sandaracinobacteroides hominis TaxID=2780086 RepID=UPI0018F6244B|nr:hypothetical protein [Sandaracinobacteroides hominis]